MSLTELQITAEKDEIFVSIEVPPSVNVTAVSTPDLNVILAGNIGPSGPQGPVGSDGPQGPAGSDGSDGLPGPEGPIGPEGPEGPVGPSGAQGPKGDTGTQGIKGDQGLMGPSGQSAGKIYYYTNINSDIAGYKKMLDSPSINSESNITVVCPTIGADVLLASFVSEPGSPGAVDYPAGTAYRNMYAFCSSGTMRLHYKVYKRTEAGVETLIRDEFSNIFNNQVVALQEWMAASPSGGSLAATDRIVNKIYAQKQTGGAGVTCSLTVEGTSHGSQIQTTISAGAQGPPGPPGPQGQWMSLTQVEYNALSPPDPETLYVIVE